MSDDFRLRLMLRRYVYIAPRQRVGDLQHPKLRMTLSAFRHATAAQYVVHTGPRGGRRKELIADQWLRHLERLTVLDFERGPMDRPSDPYFCDLIRDPSHAADRKPASVTPLRGRDRSERP